jgi:hypothetical protein
MNGSSSRYYILAGEFHGKIMVMRL